MKEGALNRFLLWALPPLLALVLRIWFSTCRVRVHNGEYFLPIQNGRSTGIGVCWHFSLVYVVYYIRKLSVSVMVSASKDGEYISRFVKHLGFSVVRGSRNRKGLDALKKLIRVVQSRQNCALVADGSQGPARVVQPGALLLSSKSSAPVIPVTWSASRYFSFKSWDRTAIPKPFSTIDLFFGEPIQVPPGLDAKQLEEYRLLLEQRLNGLYKEAWNIYGKDKH